jgi:hypothetical protein
VLELNYALNLIVKGIESTTDKIGLQVEYPEGVRPPEAPVATDGKKSFVMFRGEKGRIRIEYSENKLALHIASADEGDAPDDDMPRVSLNLLALDEYDERDLKYIFDEYIETIEKAFIGKAGNSNKKMPTPVSRTQARSGALSYDANTLGDRFTKIYPELRDEYKKNVELYDEFLAEDFFLNYGNALVIETIRENDKIKMRKLFNLLNDIYDDGTNDTQSLVGVTILGECLSSNPELLENAKPYFGEVMNEPVNEIIGYLTKSKSARMRLANPPLYKPKKEKKKGMVSSMLGM